MSTTQSTPTFTPSSGGAATARPRPCPNCGEPAHGPFCSACGQKNTLARLELRPLIRESLGQWLNVESALARTVIGLSRAPGQLCRDYVAGRRKRYVHPFKYCLTAVALYFFANALMGLEVGPTIGVPDDPQQVERFMALRQFVVTHLSNILFLALPLFVAILSLLFRSSGFNGAEIFAFTLFVTGHGRLVGLAVLPLAFLAPMGAVMALRLLLQLTFFVWASVTFFEVCSLSGVLRSLVAYVAYVGSVVLVAVILSLGRLMLGGF